MNKRIIGLLLAAVLFCTTVIRPDFVSAYSKQSVNNAGTRTSDRGLSESSDTDTLKKLSFDLPEESEYSTSDINSGMKAIEVMSELSYEVYTSSRADAYVYDNDTGAGVQSCADTSQQTIFSDIKAGYYTVSTGIDMFGHGKRDFIARIHLENGEYGGRILLSIINTNGINGQPLVEYYDTGGYIKTSQRIQSWELEGLINLTAGDFDGDGCEELAVYAPNNSDEVESTKAPWTPDRLEVKIYDLNMPEFGQELTPVLLQTINIADGTNEWSYSSCNSSKQFYAIPYLSMTAEDLDNDNVDDLMTVANFSTKYRYFSASGITWERVLNPDECFASVLDVYKGDTGETGLTQTIKKKPLVSTSDNNGNNGYVLRNATAIVGNVTGPDSREIIIGGNYTTITYNSNTQTNSVVTNTREVSLNGEQAKTIVGYTTYEQMLSDDTASSSTEYNWTVLDNGYSKLHYYPGDVDMASEPVALAAFAAYGYELADTIFLEGQLFEYSDESGSLACNGYVPQAGPTSGMSNKWIGSVAAGNVTNSPMGQETVYYSFMTKIKGKDLFRGHIVSICGTTKAGKKSYSSSVKEDKYKGTDKLHVDLNMINIDDDTAFIKYEPGNTEVYYSDVELMSVMQAAPVWKELGEDYTEDAETTYSKSSGSSSGNTVGGTVTAGVVAGFEQETSFLGLFKCAGMAFETKVTFSLGYQYGYTSSKEFTTSYNAKGSNDVAVIYTVPYVRYKCKVYMPSYSMPTKEEYDAKKEFAQELEKNMMKYLQYKATVAGGKYSAPNDGYNDWYTTDVSADNYNSQLKVYQDYLEWFENAESTIKDFGCGGEYSWGEEINYGVWKDYYYNIPQTPVVTTIDVAKYDEIAGTCKDLAPIYGNIFDEDYRAGDPGTYAGTVSELNVAPGTEVLTGKTNTGSSADSGGFITSSSLSSGNSTPSQTITVEKEKSHTISFGSALETTLTVNAGGANLGVTSTLEANGSHSWISTEGNEYSGQVPNLPAGTDDAYSYGWKLVAYTARLNNKSVPVVGYLTKLNRSKMPPSVPNDMTATELNDSSIMLQWTKGNRPAEAYNVYRVLTSGDRVEYDLIGTVSEDDFGVYSFIDDAAGDGGLDPETEYSYVVQAVSGNEVSSVYSGDVKAKTLPEGMNISNVIKGMDSNFVYGIGQDITLSSYVVSDSDTKYKIRGYEWQYNDGYGWKKADGNNKESEYTFKTSALKDGFQYRCKASVQVGSTTSGYVYEVYSNVLVQQAKRSEISLVLEASKVQGADEASIAYGVAAKDKIKLSASLKSENEVAENVSGIVTVIVSYQDKASDSEDKACLSVKKYTAELNKAGNAEVELPFAKEGIYTISAEYSGNEYYQNTVSDNEYSYYAYSLSDETVTDMFDFGKAEISLEKDSYAYTGRQVCPEIDVKWNGTILEKDKDYTVTYSDNIDVGDMTGNIKVIPAGKFEGQTEKTVAFSITKASPVITVDKEAYVVSLGDNTQRISASTDVDGTLEYTSSDTSVVSIGADGAVTPLKTGTVNITISLSAKEGCYDAAKKTVRLKVSGKDISGADASFDENEILTDKAGNKYVYYYGTECKPGVNVLYGNSALNKDTDYILSYQDNSEVGQALVQIIGKGDYCGVKSLSFELKEGVEATATPKPTKVPEATVTPKPTKVPEATATSEPTKAPEPTPTKEPGARPTNKPAARPTKKPTVNPTRKPLPTAKPSTTASPKPGITSESSAIVNVSSISVKGISKKIAAGKKVSLTAQIMPENATDKSLNWTSSNTKYATVSASGIVKTKKAGAGKTVSITASANDGSGVTAVYRIRIMKNAVTGVKFASNNMKIKAGKKQKIKFKVKVNGAGANKKLQWTSSQKNWATVNSKGVVSAKAKGKGRSVVIKAMATDGSNKKAVIVISII